MALDRTALNAILATIVDDSGSGMDGTPWNKAIIDALFDATLDSVDASGAITPGVLHVTATGPQTIAVTPATTVIRCTNAALVSIQGFSGGSEGQVLRVYAAGAGVVEFADGLPLANGIVTGIAGSIYLSPGAASPFNNGRATLLWDATLGRWRVLHHEQGTWIPYTPVWATTGTAPTPGAGSIAGAYRLQGRTCHFRLKHIWGAGTAGGTGAFTYSYPFAWAAAMPFVVMLNDASVGGQAAVGDAYSPTAWVVYNVGAPNGVNAGAPFAWTAGDFVSAAGTMEL